MLISELLNKLEEFKTLHGDIEIKVYPYDGQMNPHNSESVDVVNEKVTGWNQAGMPDNCWFTELCEPYVLIE